MKNLWKSLVKCTKQTWGDLNLKQAEIILVCSRKSIVCITTWSKVFHFSKEKAFLILYIVGKGGHTTLFLDQPPPPISKIPPFLEIQDVPTFHMFIGKIKVLNNSCNQFVYNSYLHGIFILEECLQKWWNTNLI